MPSKRESSPASSPRSNPATRTYPCNNDRFNGASFPNLKLYRRTVLHGDTRHGHVGGGSQSVSAGPGGREAGERSRTACACVVKYITVGGDSSQWLLGLLCSSRARCLVCLLSVATSGDTIFFFPFKCAEVCSYAVGVTTLL